MGRRRGRWAIAIGWIVLLLARKEPSYGQSKVALDLEVVNEPKSSQPARSSPSGATLVLNALHETRRQQLADSLARLAAVADKKKNPFFVSLDDSDERAAVEDLIKQTAPLFTAASMLCAGRWQSSDGDLTIRPVGRCATNTRCVHLARTSAGDDFERRVRFLAWPLGYAILVSVAPRKDVDKIAEALRAPGSTQIALVLTSAELHSLRKSPALTPLLEHSGHVVKTAPAKGSALLDVLARIAGAATTKDELPWLKLPGDVVLVVPRLGSLATSEAFVADVRARLKDSVAHLEWLASPL